MIFAHGHGSSWCVCCIACGLWLVGCCSLPHPLFLWTRPTNTTCSCLFLRTGSTLPRHALPCPALPCPFVPLRHVKNMTEKLLYLDVHSYPYVGLSEGYIKWPSFCGVPAYVEGIQRFFNESGLTAAIGMSPTDVRAHWKGGGMVALVQAQFACAPPPPPHFVTPRPRARHLLIFTCKPGRAVRCLCCPTDVSRLSFAPVLAFAHARSAIILESCAAPRSWCPESV
jgi:hypothetical protein